MRPPCSQPCGVQVGVVDAGDRGAPVQLDHRARIQSLRLRTQSDDHPVADGERLRDRVGRVEGADAAAADDQVGIVAVE